MYVGMCIQTLFLPQYYRQKSPNVSAQARKHDWRTVQPRLVGIIRVCTLAIIIIGLFDLPEEDNFTCTLEESCYGAY